MGAQKQHDRFAVAGFAFHFGQCAKPLAGKAFGQQWEEVRDRGAGGELVVGGVQEPFDGFHSEHIGELVLQPGCGGLERQLLIDGQVAAKM